MKEEEEEEEQEQEQELEQEGKRTLHYCITREVPECNTCPEIDYYLD
jgi:hypothetical protein